MKVNADTGICVASGQCAMLAPDVFGQRDADGIVALLDEQPPPAQQEAARQAVLTCPSGALQLIEP